MSSNKWLMACRSRSSHMLPVISMETYRTLWPDPPMKTPQPEFSNTRKLKKNQKSQSQSPNLSLLLSQWSLHQHLSQSQGQSQDLSPDLVLP